MDARYMTVVTDNADIAEWRNQDRIVFSVRVGGRCHVLSGRVSRLQKPLHADDDHAGQKHRLGDNQHHRPPAQQHQLLELGFHADGGNRRDQQKARGLIGK